MESSLTAAVAAPLGDAHFRTAFAGFARISDNAYELRDQVGHSILQKCFPQYGALFARLADGLRMIQNAPNSPRNRAMFLRWADENCRQLTAMHKEMLACKSAAFDAKRRARKNFRLAALACALTALGALVALTL